MSNLEVYMYMWDTDNILLGIVVLKDILKQTILNLNLDKKIEEKYSSPLLA